MAELDVRLLQFMKASIILLAILLVTAETSNAFSFAGPLPQLSQARGELVMESNFSLKNRKSGLRARFAKRKLHKIWENFVSRLNAKVQSEVRSFPDFKANPRVDRFLYRHRKAVFTYTVHIPTADVPAFQARMRNLKLRRSSKTRYGSIFFRISLEQTDTVYQEAEQGAAANP